MSMLLLALGHLLMSGGLSPPMRALMALRPAALVYPSEAALMVPFLELTAPHLRQKANRSENQTSCDSERAPTGAGGH